MRALLLSALLCLNGCVYYNGVYNAEKLAGRARKAEREGRTLEASGLWGQVLVRTDTVLARHPQSKYTAQLNLLQGTAYSHLRDCTKALPPLQRAASLSTRPDLTEESASLLGQCYLTLGNPARAVELYATLLGSPVPSRRDLAFYEHGRALRANGEFAAALAELQQSTQPGARGERAAALAGLGRVEALTPVVDSLLEAHDSLAPWGGMVDLLAARDTVAAAALLERLTTAEELPAILRARLIIQDGERLQATDTARAEARYAAAEELGRRTSAVQEARFARVRSHVLHAESVGELAVEQGPLEDLASGTGIIAPEAVLFSGRLRRVVLVADSVAPGEEEGDMRLFLGGELARDSLEAMPFARQQFRRVLAEWPESPFGPKALLALIAIDSVEADSLRMVMRERFAGSPYLAVLEGNADPEYAQLEDSLRRFSLGLRPGIPSRLRRCWSV